MSSDYRKNFAIVDLANARGLRSLVMGRQSREAQTLFSPNLDVLILQSGPWIVDVEKVPEFDAALEAEAADLPWGYYIESSVEIVSLRRALRRYNYVQVPDYEEPVLFRYWDPRIMRVFLEVMTPAQKGVFFDFVKAVDLPSEGVTIERPHRYEL